MAQAPGMFAPPALPLSFNLLYDVPTEETKTWAQVVDGCAWYPGDGKTQVAAVP